MRCPHCRQENQDDSLHCGQCGGRLFAWLGDPFGNLEPGPAVAPAALRGPRAGAGPAAGPAGEPPWGRIALLSLFLSPWFVVLPGWALLVACAVALALWRRPRMGDGAFVALLFGAVLGPVLLAWLFSSVAPGGGQGAAWPPLAPRATATPTPARPPRPTQVIVPTRTPAPLTPTPTPAPPRPLAAAKPMAGGRSSQMGFTEGDGRQEADSRRRGFGRSGRQSTGLGSRRDLLSLPDRLKPLLRDVSCWPRATSEGGHHEMPAM